jgi:hypothetical protein
VLAKTPAHILKCRVAAWLFIHGAFVQELHERAILTSEGNLLIKIVALSNFKLLRINRAVGCLRVGNSGKHRLLAIG